MSPPISQASRIKPAEGIDFAIMPVVRKIPEPMTIPTIIMMESKRPNFRTRDVDGWCDEIDFDISLHASLLERHYQVKLYFLTYSDPIVFKVILPMPASMLILIEVLDVS